MPKGTPVDRQYQAIKKKELAAGRPLRAAEAKAARIAQASTGTALATGRKPKGEG